MKENDQAIVSGESEVSRIFIRSMDNNKKLIDEFLLQILHHLADVIYYGALEPCTQCTNGRLVFRNSAYFCNGTISEWARCDNCVKEPERRTTLIPQQIRNLYPCLAETFPVQTRVSRDDSEHSPPKQSVNSDTVDEILQKVEVKSKLLVIQKIYFTFWDLYNLSISMDG